MYFRYAVSKTCDQNNGISSITSERPINGKNFQTKNLLINDFSVKDEITIKNIKVENRKYIYKNNGVSLQDHINEPMKKLFESYPNEINKIVVSIPVFFQDSQKTIIKDSINSIKKESKIYFLKEPIAAIISDNEVYKVYTEKNGHFYLILIFYDDLYEISIALYPNNWKNPEYSIGEDFNFQDLIKVLENIQQKNKLENENLLEKILKEIKQLFGKVELDFNNFQKIIILSENGLTKEQSINFQMFLKRKFNSLKLKEVTIKFLKIEDTIIKGVEKYESKKILENEGFPIEIKKVTKYLKKGNEEPQTIENIQSLPNNSPQTERNIMIKKKNFEGNISYVNKPIEKNNKKKRKTKNDCNLENIKTDFKEEEIEYNFDTTEYSEKKDNKKNNNGMTYIKSENNQEKLEEMILQLITKSEQNNTENIRLQKLIFQSNREDNKRLKEMIFHSNRILQKMMFENNIKLQKMIKENIFKLDQKYDNKFFETENQIEELQNKVNKISENKNGKTNTFPFIFSKSSSV